MIIRIDAARITDWNSFHAVFAETFGYPSFYGANMNAWVDCMSYLDDPDAAMTSVRVTHGDIVTLQIHDADDFKRRCPDQYVALVECVGDINARRLERGDAALLILTLDDAT